MNLDELKDTVTKLNEERKRLVQAEGQKAISEAFKEVFAAHPKLESVSWTQYTPYFNDGDACVFGYHGIREAVYGGEEIEDPEYGDELDKADKDALLKLGNSLDSLGECLELIFGDHVMVKATRDGFEVEEYSHD